MSQTSLGEALEKSIWELHQLEKIIELGADDDARVVEKIEDFVRTLTPLREAADARDDEIAVDLVREVDQGKKPMGFMIEQILEAGRMNELVKGKTNVFREFHDALEQKTKELNANKK